MIVQRESEEVRKLYRAQDIILKRLSPTLVEYRDIWLSGGTVLAREWLQHRVSFDLDFFVPHDFPLDDFSKSLSEIGFVVERVALGDDIYQQLFGRFSIDGQNIEVSFIQDKFHHLFTPVPGRILDLSVPLEDAMSIYRRKVSIIIGLSERYFNGRNKARDIFDLHVLSEKVMPIQDFIVATWGEAMLENFYDGLARLDPMQISTDGQLLVFPEWESAGSGDKALGLVMEHVGMVVEDIDDVWSDQTGPETDGAEKIHGRAEVGAQMHKTALRRLLLAMCPGAACKDWEEFNIAVFWSCPHITREQWIARLTQNSPAATSILEDTLSRSNIRSFFNFFPMGVFSRKWPTMRLYCGKKLFGRRCLFDMAWSFLVTGTAFVPPLPEWVSLPSAAKNMVTEVSKHLWRNADELAGQFGDDGRSIQKTLVRTGFLREADGKLYPGIAHRMAQTSEPRSKTWRLIKKNQSN